MKKTLTKEALAAQLDGCEYRNGIPNEIVAAAKENNLVIITGASDDLVELRGAITEEIGVCSVLRLTKKGVPESDCDSGEQCNFYRRWLESAVNRGDVREIKVYLNGKHNGELHDPVGYKEAGSPTWCFGTEMPHAVFDMLDTDGDEREFFCRGIIIDLDEWFPPLNYTQMVMNGRA